MVSRIHFFCLLLHKFVVGSKKWNIIFLLCSFVDGVESSNLTIVCIRNSCSSSNNIIRYNIFCIVFNGINQ